MIQIHNSLSQKIEKGKRFQQYDMETGEHQSWDQCPDKLKTIFFTIIGAPGRFARAGITEYYWKPGAK